MELLKNPNLTIKTSPCRGYGVFATEDIKKGTLLEVCHHIPIPKEEIGTLLRDYRFWTTKEKTHFSIVFGYASLYNSSPTPNALWVAPDNLTTPFIFMTIKDVKKDEEIFIDYQNILNPLYDTTTQWRYPTK